jgi:methionyl aminopeptidase
MEIHSDFSGMRKAGILASQTLDYISDFVKEGVTTNEINDLCHDFIVSNGAIPAPLNYLGFPKSVCTSINHVVCHGIPCEKKLARGDIINIDITVILDGWHGDTSRMYFVDPISKQAEKLITTTKNVLSMAIDFVKPGIKWGSIAYKMQEYVEKYGYSMVKDYCGHGIGRVFHAEPHVPHFGKEEYFVIEEGMCFTIEPMVNAGKYHVVTLADKWTSVTKDKSLSAQFEHTLGVTKDGCEVFTRI